MSCSTPSKRGTTTNWKRNWATCCLQVVFHCQLARERGAFDFEKVARHITDKLIRRHPHVFGKLRVKDVDQVWANWEKIKRAEKHGTRHARPSALDGIPKHLPALLRAGEAREEGAQGEAAPGARRQAGPNQKGAGRTAVCPGAIRAGTGMVGGGLVAE